MDAMNDLRRVFFEVIFVVSVEVLIIILQDCLVGVFVHGKSVTVVGDVGRGPTVPLPFDLLFLSFPS